VDGSTSRLTLALSLPRGGLVSFIYTAHGEPYFDYMKFSVDGQATHQTRQWSDSGAARKRYSQMLTAGAHELTWEWIKDESVSFADDRATIQQLLITGTGSDDASAGCDECPPGSCGHGGIQGCAVCAVNRRAESAGAAECAVRVPCTAAPQHGGGSASGPTPWLGPPDARWPVAACIAAEGISTPVPRQPRHAG